MWVGKIGGLEAEGASVSIHLLDEILHRLVRWDPSLILIVLTVVIILSILVLPVSAILTTILFLSVDRSTTNGWSTG